MRHRRKGRKLGRDASHRKALYANMCGALFEHGRIQTVGDLISKSEAELAAIPNFGKKSIDEVIETLQARGLGLRQD